MAVTPNIYFQAPQNCTNFAQHAVFTCMSAPVSVNHVQIVKYKELRGVSRILHSTVRKFKFTPCT